MGDVHAVPEFRERRLRDMEKIQTRTRLRARKSFSDISRHRIRRSAELTPELEAFERRKRIQGKTMELNE